MTPQEFLSLFWVSTWHRALVRDTGGGFRHYWSPTVDDFAGTVNGYFAIAEFDKESRRKECVASVKALWLDVDVKKGHHETLEDAVKAVRDMVERFRLPSPLLVKSGAGLHVYFICAEGMTAAEWHPLAAGLRAICEESGLSVDHKRTQDIASIMRFPGTINVKAGRGPLDVRILKDTFENVPLAKFKSIFGGHSPKAPKAPKELTYRQEADILSFFGDDHKAARYDPDLIASQCAQVAKVRASRGDVSEPLWYHTLQLLRFVKDGHEVSHAWSSGHPNYSVEETDKKIVQLEHIEAGPTTCARFQAEGDKALCAACLHRGNITTPLSLGAQGHDEGEGRLSTPVANRLAKYNPEIPPPYYIDEDGAVFMRGKNGEGALIHPRTMFVDRRFRESDAQWYFSVVVDTHRDGVREIRISSEALGNAKSFYTELALAGVLSNDMPREERHLYNYIYQCASLIWKETEVVDFFERYGWDSDRKAFNLGLTRYSDAGATTAEFAEDATPTVVPDGHELSPWREVVHHYATAPLSFRVAFFASLAAPLMHMTGLSGVLFSLFSPLSGIGKTTVLEAACAVWGDPRELLKRQNDTINSLLNYAGGMHNLPICVDEFSCAKVEDFQHFIYEVSGGHERSRLTKDIRQRKGGQWSTIFTASTNSSLVAQLPLGDNFEGLASRIVEAQVFEYTTGDALGRLHDIIREHWGTLGHAWAQHLVQHRERLQDIAQKMHKRVQAQSAGSYRYYSALISCVSIAMHEVGQLLGVDVGDARQTIKAFMETFTPGTIKADLPGAANGEEAAQYGAKAIRALRDSHARLIQSIVSEAASKGTYAIAQSEKKAAAKQALGVAQPTYMVLEDDGYLVVASSLCGRLAAVMGADMEPVNILPGGTYTRRQTVGVAAYRVKRVGGATLRVAHDSSKTDEPETDEKENANEQCSEAR